MADPESNQYLPSPPPPERDVVVGRTAATFRRLEDLRALSTAERDPEQRLPSPLPPAVDCCVRSVTPVASFGAAGVVVTGRKARPAISETFRRTDEMRRRTVVLAFVLGVQHRWRQGAAQGGGEYRHLSQN